MVPEPQPALKTENGRQRRGDEQEIVEVLVKERPVEDGSDQPTIGRMENARRQTQWVQRIAKRLHRRAVMTRPTPRASSTFRPNNIMKIR